MDTSAISKPSATAASAASGSGQSQIDRAKVESLVQEFEAYFLVQMIRQMRESMLDDQKEEGLGAGTMTDNMDVELSRQLTQCGGIGLSKFLQGAIERQTVGAQASGAAVQSLNLMSGLEETAGLRL